MKLKPHHYILIAIGFALIGAFASYFAGRNSKQCPVYVNSDSLVDNVRLQYEERLIAARQEERDLYQHKIDSALQSISSRPIKRQITDAVHTLSGLPNDNIADSLLADPE